MALKYNFVKVFESGQLALSERPKIKEIKKLKTDNCTRVVSLLGRRGENAHQIGSEVEAQGMLWDWIKVGTATDLPPMETVLLKNAATTIATALKSGESVIIHCSAGLHRTGILAYCILRNGGMTSDESLSAIGMMREETASALTGKYLETAESLIFT